MTTDDDRPDLHQAARHVQESAERAQRDLDEARKRSRQARSLADKLRGLREENGFRDMFIQAMRGSGG
uniref:DUF7620 family protein n=1 Tax=Herbidospora sakaeratensis TaxID=564415 RepID=UPI0007845840|nr:hypothetical protein [Herbidospora sakaeratensis]